jgi:hypothetical protein
MSTGLTVRSDLDTPRSPLSDTGSLEEAGLQRGRARDAELSASADSVRAYLQQIGKVALLTAEQEVDLTQRIEVGLYAAERLGRCADATDKLAPQLHRDLRWIVRDGERAENHLLEANLRLVVSLAKRYTGRGMPLLDLVQEGNLGLIGASRSVGWSGRVRRSSGACALMSVRWGCWGAGDWWCAGVGRWAAWLR